MPSVYDFNFKNIAGKVVKGQDYQGRVLLIVNVASRCGFTPQYEGLKALHERYHERGLTVLGFPCDDFGGQEPGDEAEIAGFCERRFSVPFELMSKVSIRGENPLPLYQFLESARLPAKNGASLKARLFQVFKRFYYLVRSKPLPTGSQVSWNFHKFLIDRHGRPVGHYGSGMEPGDRELTCKIEEELDKA